VASVGFVFRRCGPQVLFSVRTSVVFWESVKIEAVHFEKFELDQI
jgi:hypothetical protein